MIRSPFFIGLLTITLLLAGCTTDAPAQSDTPAATAEPVRAPAAHVWLIRDPAGLVAQLNPSVALAELTIQAAAAPAAPLISTAALAGGEAQAPMPTQRPVVLPPNNSA